MPTLSGLTSRAQPATEPAHKADDDPRLTTSGGRRARRVSLACDNGRVRRARHTRGPWIRGVSANSCESPAIGRAGVSQISLPAAA